MLKWTAFFSLACATILCAQTDITDSGGPLMPEQAAYDVTYYELTLEVKPDNKSIQGPCI